MGSLPLTKRGHFYYGLLAGGLSFVTRLFLLPGDTLPLGILLAGFAIPVYNFLSRNARKLREKRFVKANAAVLDYRPRVNKVWVN
jgi:hypothetical protein